jgi:NAD(P)-dependent dehydrogenase (short-subunit alcohol dehydrogenase family)
MAHSFVGWTQTLLDQDLLAPESLLLGLTNPWTGHVVRNTAAIAASKAALEVYVRHLAVELGPLGHRVNLLRYGFVPTEATRRTFPGEAYEALQRSLQELLPAGRVCTVEEVDQLVAFLASPPGRWFNGATIDYTGAEGLNAMDRLIYGARKESP